MTRNETKQQKSFYLGMATSLVTLFLGLGLWVTVQVVQVIPAVYMSPNEKGYKKISDKSATELASSLQRLYFLTKFLGLEELSSLAIGSAGALLAKSKSPASQLQARYFYLQAIEEGQKVAMQDKAFLWRSLDNYDPLLEAYYHYSLFLNDKGERLKAKKTLRQAKKMAENEKSKSHWIKNIDTAIHLINMETI